MDTNIKIALAIPTFGTIKSKTALVLMETIRLNPEIEFLPIFCHSGYIAENRNKLVRLAQDNLCSHIFFVDYDMVFPADTVKKLLANDKDAVGVLYSCRYLPPTSTTMFYGANGGLTRDIPDTKELIEVPVVGAGCLLIKMSVFSELETPYFPMEQDDDGNRVLTEDAGFCDKVIKAGMKVWCDLAISVGHIGDYTYQLENK